MKKLLRTLPKLRGLTAGVALVAGLVFASGAAESATLVDCDHGGKILHALQQGNIDLVIKGTCIEIFAIASDDVILTGHPSSTGGTVEGTIAIKGASGVVIEGLVVIGDSEFGGIDIFNASSVEIRNTEVMVPDMKDVCGISVANASFLKIVESDITGVAVPTSDDHYGLCVGTGSVVRGQDNTITGSTHGVALFQHGTYIGDGDTIEGTSGRAAEAFSSSFLQFKNSTLTENVKLGRLSLAHLRNTTVNGGVEVIKMSFVEVSDGTTCNGITLRSGSGSGAAGASLDCPLLP